LRFILFLIFAMLAASCSNIESIKPPGETVPEGWIRGEDALHVDSNGCLRNKNNQEIILRGVNLGGWMIQESWMCPVTGADKAWANLDTINAMEIRGWSAAQIQELFDTYQDNWITEDDFDFFKNCGVNSIRIPIWYRNFMSDDKGAWINDNGSKSVTANPGFKRLDWAILEAKKRGMYVIPDMHGVPGGQSMDHSCGTLAKNEVYTNAAYEQITVDLWKAIAKRYKDEAAVAAYDLLNEPQNNNDYTGSNAWKAGSNRAVYETVRLYDRLYREIRIIDPDTIIIMEGIWSMNLPNPLYAYNGAPDINVRYSGKKTSWNKNVMYSMHLYDKELPGLNSRVDELLKAREDWKVAVHIGEFNNGDINQAAAYVMYNANKINWNMWTYKLAGANMGNWSLHQGRRKLKADPVIDSFETIKEKWGETLRTFENGTQTIAEGWTRQAGFDWYNLGQNQ